ncbi:hypothetical protein CERSUDRAFT_99951 [Gelatoporia subvermispora B]|uniref:Uncharacterized protein n=1 Tax=Ceriporiopsis subvermispora (strain B) TaxID=914234 RepID=M2QIR3_CERS8|nr:hypothetical protein CERSUDRAFT_99951 [Gelatoporia subvermispora B]
MPPPAMLHKLLKKQAGIIKGLAEVYAWAAKLMSHVDTLPSRVDIQNMIRNAMTHGLPPTSTPTAMLPQLGCSAMPPLCTAVAAPGLPGELSSTVASPSRGSRTQGGTPHVPKCPASQAGVGSATPPGKRACTAAGPSTGPVFVDVLLSGDDGPPDFTNPNLLYVAKMLMHNLLLPSACFLATCLMSVQCADVNFYSLRFNNAAAMQDFVQEWSKTHGGNGWEAVYAYMAEN